MSTSHSSAGIAYSVFAGDYNIVDDNIFFTDAPYGAKQALKDYKQVLHFLVDYFLEN